MKYIYLDRESARRGITLVLLVSDKKKEDYEEYFEGKAIEFIGEDVPHFITYEESTDSIREATEEEKLQRGQRELHENEELIDGKITEYDPYSQKVVDGVIKNKTREDFISEGIITLEREKEKARAQREKEYTAYQKFSNNLFMGIESELTANEKEEIKKWHQSWKDTPNNYVDISNPIEDSYPVRPEKIDYYI